MGKIGEEITQQIKSAVKAKLVELGIEVDNELPDYIMVLVANKKSQAHMERDLQLFLGPNTTIFTIWLLNVLKKLEEVTVSKRNFKKIEVTNEEGCSGVVITKQEEDVENKELVKLAQIKVEPGTESNEDHLNSKESPAEETSLNESGLSNLEDTSEVVEDSSANQVMNAIDEVSASPEHEMEGDDDAEEDSSHENLSSFEHEPLSLEAVDDGTEPSSNNQTEQLIEQTNETSNSFRSKIVYSGISEQIDEVMEDTFNGNRRTRDEVEGSSDDGRSYDDDQEPIDRKRPASSNPQESKRLSEFRSRRSPNDRLRDSRRRSPLDSHRKVYDRRSPEDHRRSPEDHRRSPTDRRRSPIDRRRNSEFRRRSPYDRRKLQSDFRRSRSPNDSRRSLEKRLNDDRRRDSNRKSPEDRGRTQMLDAREILKRKSKNDNPSTFTDESQGHEKRRKIVSLVQKAVSRRREKSMEPQIPSLVRVTPRPIRKDAIQPNKKLLLLAVADAEKSVSKLPNTQRSSSTLRKREFPKAETKLKKADEKVASSPPLTYVPPEKIFITLNNQKYSDGDRVPYTNPREVSTRKVCDESELAIEDELLYEESYFDYEEEDQEMSEYVQTKSSKYAPSKEDEMNLQTKPCPTNEAKCIISLESSPERSCDEWEDMVAKAEQVEKSKSEKGGKADIDFKVEPITEDEQENVSVEKLDDGFEWSRLGPAPIATVKPLSQLDSEEGGRFKCEALNKALLRCRFWPSCLSGNCIYYHPSAPCKMFPACKSGKECLFIHPDCKFGSACSNPKCAFLHKTNEDQQKVGLEVATTPSGKTSSPLIKCLYFPNCKNLNCKFWHPVKNCKYGRTCARSDCYFFHPTLTIPPKELLTWTSRN